LSNSVSRRAFSLGLFAFFSRRRWLRIADTRFEILRNGRDRRRYVWIHGNEYTARDVLLAEQPALEGRFFLITSSERYVPLCGGKVDPNRIFSRPGAALSLERLNPRWTRAQINEALEKLDQTRPRLIRALIPNDGSLLVALHNNAEGYSVRDELPVSNRSALQDPAHPHEFFLATHPVDFEILAGGPFNVVLQNAPGGEDDGSLSRLAARLRVRYVNLEARLGNRETQTRMFRFLERVLPERLAPWAS
jgi:hypothetical protein